MGKFLKMLETGYRYDLSVKENAKLNNCSIANVRKFIQTRGIDRRYDNTLAKWELINEFAEKHKDYTPWKAAKELGINYATYIKYCGVPKPSQTDKGKVSRFGLTKYANLVKSVGNSDECLRGIAKLYVPKGTVDVDLTYSVGSMWTSSGLPQPPLKFDKYPSVEGVQPFDVDYMCVDWNTYESVLFDLPFLYGGNSKSGLKMVERFTEFESEDAVLFVAFYLVLSLVHL